MSFGLNNASSTFMNVMTHVLHHHIEKFFVVYFDDILTYSKTQNKHLEHLQQVFCTLRDAKLYANLKRNTFMQERVLFLGFFISKTRT